MGENVFKRGELTSATIIPLILLIAGFGVLVYVGYQLFFADDSLDLNTQRQLCELSVLTRATANERFKAITPLKCITEKICISANDGDCLNSFSGEKGIQDYSLKGSKDEGMANEIDSITAQAMYDCWNMMGQGKMDLFGKYFESIGLEPTQPTCVICSRIAIDGLDADTAKNVNDKLDLDSFLKNNLAPQSSKTYMELFTDKDVKSYPEVSKEFKPTDTTPSLASGKLLGETKPLGEIAVVFMQIKPNTYNEVFTRIGGDLTTLSVGAFLLPGGKYLARGALSALSTTGGAVLAVSAIIGTSAYVTYNTYLGRTAAAGYCGKFTSTGEVNKWGKNGDSGCSIVQVMPYSAKQLNAFCTGGIQGVP